MTPLSLYVHTVYAVGIIPTSDGHGVPSNETARTPVHSIRSIAVVVLKLQPGWEQ